VSPRRWSAIILCAAAAAWGLWVCAHAFTRAPAWHAPWLDHPARSFPFWQQALARAVRALVGASITWLAAWQLGRLLTSRASTLFADAAERGQISLAIGTVALSSLLTCLAAVGAYKPRVVEVLLVSCVISRPGAAVRELRWGVAGLVGTLRHLLMARRDLALAACAAIAGLFALVAALAPEVNTTRSGITCGSRRNG